MLGWDGDNMKKIISLIILCVMFMIGGVVYADETPRISVSNVSGGVGDIVKVNISISNNPGIASYKLKLNFDNTKIIPETISGEGITSNIQQSGIDKSSCECVTAVWESASDMAEDGVLFSISFKIITKFEDDTPIRLSYSIGDICNQELEDVLVLTSNGSISIAKQSKSTYSTSADGKTISVTTTLDEFDTDTRSQAMIITALYDEKSILLGVDTAEYLSSNAQCTLENHSTASYIKIFVWDKNIGMRPLTSYVERIDL